MHMLKKQIACFLAVLILLQVIVVPASAAPAEVKLELNAKAAVLIDAENETVLYEKDAQLPLPPASLTKLMTLLLAMEDLKSGLVDWDTCLLYTSRSKRTYLPLIFSGNKITSRLSKSY